jgi:hypothetical protein
MARSLSHSRAAAGSESVTFAPGPALDGSIRVRAFRGQGAVMRYAWARRRRAAQVAVIAAALQGCAAPHAALIGVWKSDAARTLEALRAAPGIPPERRRALENDYYGHLVVEYRRSTVRAYFDNSDYDSGRRPYEVVEVAPDRIVTREWNELLLQFEESTTYLDGECIYGLDAGYREYFCPFTE